MGLGSMYELDCKLDLLVLVGWGFGRRVRFRATSPYASPVPVTNLWGGDTQVNGSVGLLCEDANTHLFDKLESFGQDLI